MDQVSPLRDNALNGWDTSVDANLENGMSKLTMENGNRNRVLRYKLSSEIRKKRQSCTKSRL